MAKAMGVEHIVFVPAVVPVHSREEAERWVPDNPKYQPRGMKRLEEGWEAGEVRKVSENAERENVAQGNSKLKRRMNCSWLWTQASVNWDGSVSPCCDLYDSSLDFGSLANRPFKEVWNNEKYRVSRRFSSKGKVGGSRTICMECPAASHE